MEFVKIKPTYSVHLNPRLGDAVDWNGIGVRSRRARGPASAGLFYLLRWLQWPKPLSVYGSVG